MTEYLEHASPTTVMERAVELIEEMKTHPHQEEIFRLAAQQLEDMYSTDCVN